LYTETASILSVMVFGTDPHLQRAQKLLASGDRASLRYVCLELRFALERIAYQKLQLRLDKITIEEIGAWQPRRAMERLMELVDEHLAGDSVLRVALENEEGAADEGDFVTVGATKGIKPKDIGKHWQKLGSFLHAEVPKTKGDRPREPDEQMLRQYLGEVISYVGDVTSTRFDAHFSENVTLTCGRCDQSIVRNAKLLKEGDVVQCQNPNCTASYITHETRGNFTFEPYRLQFECQACKERNFVDANDLLKLERDHLQPLKCAACGAKYHAGWVLQLKPAPPDG